MLGFTAEPFGGVVCLSVKHEGGCPLDNPEDAITHLTIPRSLRGITVFNKGHKHLVLHNRSSLYRIHKVNHNIRKHLFFIHRQYKRLTCRELPFTVLPISATFLLINHMTFLISLAFGTDSKSDKSF